MNHNARRDFIAIIAVMMALSTGVAAAMNVTWTDFSFSKLKKCVDSSHSMSNYGQDDLLDPCVLYDIRDSSFDNFNLDSEFSLSEMPNISEIIDPEIDSDDSIDRITPEITLVQVTPSFCNNHRDGAVTAVRKLNADNNGKGVAIGYRRDHFVKFRLISIVGGNSKNMTDAEYKEIHKILLDSVLEEVDTAQYILGSCSFASVADKPVALKRKKVVISQVGPPGFYMDVATNPYVFGIHVNSDTYPLPALQALEFHLISTEIPTSKQPVRVIYRDKSKFFYSTCRSVIDEATSKGFDVTPIEYDPEGFEGGSTVKNSQNIPFLEGLADRLCPLIVGKPTGDSDIYDHHSIEAEHPAIFACVLDDEADAILTRMRSNGCRPSLAWFTTATWSWANKNPEVVPFFQGAGQWHENFEYSDQYFQTGQAVLDFGLQEFGYSGSYDHVVSYTIPTIIAEVMVSFFRFDDHCDVEDVFLNQYEALRRVLAKTNTDTIFGPVSFNEYQRNNGRGPASMQWITKSTSEKTTDFVLGCMSPSDQAEAPIVIPSPSGDECSPGHHVNQTMIKINPALLQAKCSACPINSFMSKKNERMECIACMFGSSTMDETGAVECVQQSANLNPQVLKSMGYVFVVLSWSLAIGYIVWMVSKRNGSVVKIGQPEFLFLICIGAIISTSAIIPLTLAEADVGEDTTAASRNCQAIPFLYSLGWVLMYSSLTAKSYRLNKIAAASMAMRRKAVQAKEMYVIIAGFILLDTIILIAWQVVDPLVYVRSFQGQSKDDNTGVVTIETVGQCSSNSLWKFLGPIIGIHFCLMIITNGLLWRVRNMSDRYQEQKYVALASIYICELLLLGVPILFAVQDSAAARYIVIAGVIFLTDTGVLSFIFLPKIRFESEGLPEGVSVAQSLNIGGARNPVKNLSRYGLHSVRERPASLMRSIYLDSSRSGYISSGEFKKSSNSEWNSEHSGRFVNSLHKSTIEIEDPPKEQQTTTIIRDTKSEDIHTEKQSVTTVSQKSPEMDEEIAKG